MWLGLCCAWEEESSACCQLVLGLEINKWLFLVMSGVLGKMPIRGPPPAHTEHTKRLLRATLATDFSIDLLRTRRPCFFQHTSSRANEPCSCISACG